MSAKSSIFRMVFRPRCPACGQGRLFTGVLQFRPCCDHCGLSLAEHDTGDGPAYFVVMGLSLVVTLMGVWVEFRFAPPLWLHVLLWTPVIILGSIGGIRAGKALLLVAQYRWRKQEMTHRNTEGDNA